MKLPLSLSSCLYTPIDFQSSYRNEIKDVFLMSPLRYQQLSKQVALLDTEKDVYLEGNQGKVYKITLMVDGISKDILLLKNRLGDKKESDESLEKEFRFHRTARELLQQHPDIAQHLAIPTLYGCIRGSDGSGYIVMDFIPGKTIYTAKICSILPLLYDRLLLHFSSEDLIKSLGPKEAFLSIQNDADAKSAMDTFFSLPFFSQSVRTIQRFHQSGGTTEYDENLDFWHTIGIANILSAKQQNNIFYIEELYTGIFDVLKKSYNLSLKEKSYTDIASTFAHEFITIMNNHHIYHNDFRSRNIILGDDGKIYIIDFGSADTQPQTYKQRINIGDFLLEKRIQSLSL